MWSTVATSSAMRSGWFSGRTWTAVPIRTRRVRAAMALATWSDAEMIERLGGEGGAPTQRQSDATAPAGRLEGVAEGAGLGRPVTQLLDEDPEVHALILTVPRGGVKRRARGRLARGRLRGYRGCPRPRGPAPPRCPR